MSGNSQFRRGVNIKKKTPTYAPEKFDPNATKEDNAFKMCKIMYNLAKRIEEFEKKISLVQGRVVNDNLKTIVINVISDYYKQKGFYHVQTTITEELDTMNQNFVILTVDVNKGKKVKVGTINVYGNKEIESSTLRMAMKETKTKFLFQPFEKWDTTITDFFRNHKKYEGKDLLQLTKMYFADRVRFRFKASKFDQQKYEEDKVSLVAKMNELGYRDAYIKSDSVYLISNREMNIDIEVEEGKRYYFRNIKWVGNTKYSSDVLSATFCSIASSLFLSSVGRPFAFLYRATCAESSILFTKSSTNELSISSILPLISFKSIFYLLEFSVF